MGKSPASAWVSAGGELAGASSSGMGEREGRPVVVDGLRVGWKAGVLLLLPGSEGTRRLSCLVTSSPTGRQGRVDGLGGCPPLVHHPVASDAALLICHLPRPGGEGLPVLVGQVGEAGGLAYGGQEP